jgi:large subunit ribosomal protein L7Ae
MPKAKDIKKVAVKAPAPYQVPGGAKGGAGAAAAKKKAAKKVVKKTDKYAALYEKRPHIFGIGGDLPPQRDMSRFTKWPRYIVLQHQKKILNQRLKVPPTINHFSKTLSKPLALSLFKIMDKHRPEDKAAKKARLQAAAAAKAAGKELPKTERAPTVQFGIHNVTALVERKKASLVVIADDVDPIELVLWLPALCRKMDVPYCIVSNKARLGTVVHQKTATCVALTAVNAGDKAEFKTLCDAVRAEYNDQWEDDKKVWGGGVMSKQSQLMMKRRAEIAAREGAKKSLLTE